MKSPFYFTNIILRPNLRMSRHTFAAAAILLSATTALAQRGTPETRRPEDDPRRSSIVRAVEQIGPSVVNI